jgi:hypothetical protein
MRLLRWFYVLARILDEIGRERKSRSSHPVCGLACRALPGWSDLFLHSWEIWRIVWYCDVHVVSLLSGTVPSIHKVFLPSSSRRPDLRMQGNFLFFHFFRIYKSWRQVL